MGRLIDTITGFKDSLTGSAFEALTAASGESFAIRWLGEGTTVTLLNAWGANNATKCQFSIKSPLLHDNVRGIRMAHMFNPTLNVADGNPQIYTSPYWKQPYQPTDTLSVEVLGTASDDVTFTQQLLYDVAGNDFGGRFMGASEVESRLRNVVGILITPSAAASTSTYGTAEAIDTDDNRLKANTDYAWLGIQTDLPFTTLKLFGPDTGNLGIACPGHWDEQVSAGWFYEMARRWQTPLIPIINSNNKGVTFSQVADAGGGSNPNITLYLAELSK